MTAHIGRNESFFFPDGKLRYVVVASDEAGDTLAGTLDPNRIAVTLDYVAEGAPQPVPQRVDERALLGALRGRALISRNDCVVCHFETSAVDQAIPTYTQIATRFGGNLAAAPALVVKIRNGSQHAWGEIPMPGHPELSDEDATAIAYYILSFANQARQEFLPVAGSIALPLQDHLVRDRFGTRMPGEFVLSASYSGPGAGTEGFGSVTARLRYASLPATAYDEAEGIQTVELDGATLLAPGDSQGRLVYRGIDLTGIGSISFLGLGEQQGWPGGSVELRLDSARGARLGAGRLTYDSEAPTVGELRIGLAPVAGRHDLYVVLRGKLAVARLCFGCGD